MPSHQESLGASKAAKFVAADPLGPMVDPFQHLVRTVGFCCSCLKQIIAYPMCASASDDNALHDDDQRDAQQELAENVNKRLTKAMDELKEKHAKGTNEVDDPDRAPTGEAYKQHYYQQQQQAQADALEKMRLEEQENREQMRQQVHQQEMNSNGNNDNFSTNNDSDDNDEFDDLLEEDNDPVLEALRNKRMQELKQAQAKHAENLAKGHGQYRTISQDEFLPECTGTSEWVAIHFFHKEFERCQILDKHLSVIAKRHLQCKFLRIDAEKAPFFVQKLAIRILPTLMVFQDGKAVNRLMGFEGLASAENPDNFPTSKLQSWLAETGAIHFDIMKDQEAREELLQEQRRGHGAIWSSALAFEDDY